ncbi:Kinesin-4 [Acorus calamus]|uniref:Kinesin-4 n=1 Tax=Acorus calamus TaxID=4465 RepID=A0AAV9CWX9_ACOCL|nr:Kinesin-4 [Acorus calamus]
MVQENHVKKNINDELVLRKAEEAACRRFQATKWLREMDRFSAEVLPSKEPSEEEFCLALRNGLILCNVLNRVNPGAVSKVVECPVFTVESTDGAAQSAIQYFENMRNFLVAVGEMKLLTFEASDLEKGGSSSKVVDCILCLKGYHEWKQSGGIGIWKYGGIVKITSSNKCIPPSILGRETVTGSSQETCSPYDECHDDHLRLLSESALEESGIGGALGSLFERFGLKLLREYLTDLEMSQLLPLNGMMVDIVTNQAVEQFYRQLESQSCQLGLMLKRALRGDKETSSKAEFLEAVSGFLDQQSYARSDCSRSSNYVERLDLQQHQIDEIKLCFHDAKVQVRQIESKWEEEVSQLGHHIQGLEFAASSYHKVLEENRLLYNQVQDLKGGQAKTLMFVHINPDVHATGETISTLKFAERVASIELGAAHANKETGELRELKEEVAKLKSALERKETEMEQLKVENMQYKALEMRTSSSGKQRRFQIPPGSTEDDRKLPLRQDTFMNSRKLRCNTSRLNKVQGNSVRMSYNKSREWSHSAGKHENKPPNAVMRDRKEGVADLRRSRSLPRGKFTNMP